MSKKSIEEIELELAELDRMSNSLDLATSDQKEVNLKVNEFAARFIASLPTSPAYKLIDEKPAGLEIGNQGKSLEELLSLYNSQVVQTGLKPASGGHIAYIPGGGLYMAALGDYLAAITNEYAGIYFGGPGAVQIEQEVIDWTKEVFGFPKSAVGNLSSGGSIANLIALTAARDKHAIKNERIVNSVIYLGQQTHHCIDKAIRIIGLEDVQLRYIDLDENHRMRMDHLQQVIDEDKSAGLNPFLIIGSAGTTDTGAVDPLNAMGAIAKKENLWFHVDAAYGGYFILVPEKKQLFDGIEMADSLVTDPHKSLFLPYGVGVVLIKDKKAVLHSHHYTANYMQDAMSKDLPISPAEISPELTKHFRGMRVWLPLQYHGIKPFIACLKEKLILTEYFREKLVKLGFKVGPIPDLSVSYFWWESNEDQNKMNEELMRLLHVDGRVFMSSTLIEDNFVIRMAILAFRTKKQTIDTALDMIEKALKTINAI